MFVWTNEHCIMQAELSEEKVGSHLSGGKKECKEVEGEKYCRDIDNPYSKKLETCQSHEQALKRPGPATGRISTDEIYPEGKERFLQECADP